MSRPNDKDCAACGPPYTKEECEISCRFKCSRCSKTDVELGFMHNMYFCESCFETYKREEGLF